jgi:hypothetical protein
VLTIGRIMSDTNTPEKPAPEPDKPVFVIQTVCECQAMLLAELGANGLVLRGWASRRGSDEPAPANTIGEPAERFDVAWHCPLCGRNTMRTFHQGALRRVAASA